MASEALIKQVKNKLDITWSDTDTDEKVIDIIDNAEAVLRHRLGITNNEFDFSLAGNENVLIKALCLYEWNNASMNEFLENYSDLIATTRAKHEVLQYDTDEET